MADRRCITGASHKPDEAPDSWAGMPRTFVYAESVAATSLVAAEVTVSA
jgi:hypothetical protein